MVGLPAAMALPVGLLEVVGGIALLVWFLTSVAYVLFIVEMIGSTILLNRYMKIIAFSVHYVYIMATCRQYYYNLA